MQHNKDSFCVLPFIHTVLNPYDSSKHETNALPCCRYSHLETEHYEYVDPINKSPTWTILQEQFLNGEKPSNCSHCWRDEENKEVSYRQNMLQTFSTVLDEKTYTEKKLLFLELMFGNTCNLSCRTCGSSYSSKWVNIDKHLMKLNIGAETTHTPSIAFANWKNIDLSNLTHLKIMGGEPFYQKGALDLLEHLSGINVLRNINLNIPTNVTTSLTNRWKELLSEAKKVHITLSIDAVGKLNDYIREGSEWPLIEENMYGFHEFVRKFSASKMYISCNTVVSVYNINKLPEISNYFKKRFLWKHYYDIAYYPGYMDSSFLPEHIKDKIIEAGTTKKISTYLKSKQYSEQNFTKLKMMTAEMDKYHNKNLKDYNPQMYQWIFNEK